jgi:hypothetical protein
MVTEGGNLIGSRPMMEKVLCSCDVELKHRVKRMAGGRMFIVGQEADRHTLSEWVTSPDYAVK